MSELVFELERSICESVDVTLSASTTNIIAQFGAPRFSEYDEKVDTLFATQEPRINGNSFSTDRISDEHRGMLDKIVAIESHMALPQLGHLIQPQVALLPRSGFQHLHNQHPAGSLPPRAAQGSASWLGEAGCLGEDAATLKGPELGRRFAYISTAATAPLRGGCEKAKQVFRMEGSWRSFSYVQIAALTSIYPISH
mmetsp:Transcript_62833/g.183746  ORF Transcript_62833/g.183746 Transcript_62833/m.183746 type:complete len:197 (+) Transcript_62833:117-707(+)